MITPSSFGFHLTNSCPLSCASCCFSAGPSRNTFLPVDLIFATIRELDPSVFRLIAFTGGEPFLLENRLESFIKCAHKRGFVTRIVTSAYWAKTMSIAGAKLKRLSAAGLDELSISWDDFHEEQDSTKMTFDYIYNAFWAAKNLGITVAVNIVQAENSRWNSERVRKELGVGASPDDVILESPLNLTGRAEIELAAVGPCSKSYLGPCPYVLSGPALSANKKLLACCGVIQHTDELILDEDFKPGHLSDAIASGMESPLLNWLYIRGPYSILEWLSEMYGIAIPDKNQVGGNCEACRLLFHRDECRKLIPMALNEKGNEITGELAVLKALGFLDKGSEVSLMSLWKDGSAFLDNTPILIRDSKTIMH